MIKLLSKTILVSVILLNTSLFAATQIFHDDFSSGFYWNAWDGMTANGSDFWGIVNDGLYAPQAWCAANSDGGAVLWDSYDDWMQAIMEKSISLSGYEHCYLQFDYNLRTDGDSDRFVVYVNGTNAFEEDGNPYIDWNPGQAGYHKIIDLSSYDGTVITLRFVFISDGSGHNEDGAFVDNIYVYGDEMTQQNQSPQAQANGPYKGCVGKPVNFSSSGSHDPDGSIVGWQWDFGDGNFSSEQSPSHTYNSSGTYTVSLRVKDNEDTWSDLDYTTATIVRPKVSALVVGSNTKYWQLPVKNYAKEIADNLRARGADVDLVLVDYEGGRSTLNGTEQSWPFNNLPDRILSLAQNKLDILKPCDSFIFTYSGHGSFFENSQNSTETPVTVIEEPNVYPDNKSDEYLVLAKSGSRRARISDNSLSYLLDDYPDIQKTIILSSCFSGGFWGDPNNTNENTDLSLIPNTGLIAGSPETAPLIAYMLDAWFNPHARNVARALEKDRNLHTFDELADYIKYQTEIDYSLSSPPYCILSEPGSEVSNLVFQPLSYASADFNTTEIISPYVALFVPSPDYSTIQSAINDAGNGDRIIVNTGTYYENINFNGKNITLTSTNPEDPCTVAATVIDGGQTDSVVKFDNSEDSNSVLNGFTITNGFSEYGAGIYCNHTSPTIRNCVITVNGGVEGNGGGIYGCNGTIANCKISSNSASPLNCGSCIGTGGGLYDCDGLIINCVITGNFAAFAGGLYDCDGQIINCTISDNCGLYRAGGLGMCNGMITNCIIWGNTAYTDSQLYDCSVPTYSCIQGQAIGEGNIDMNPCFISRGIRTSTIWAYGGDYHLLPDSPCIDTGNPDSMWTNEPWPNGSRINMGAYGNTSQATRSRDGLVHTGFRVISKTRAGRTAYEYELAIILQNQNEYDLADVELKLVEACPSITAVTDDSVIFTGIAAGQTVTSEDTFRLIIDRSVPVEPGRLTWELMYYSAAQGQSSQTVSMSFSLADFETTVTGDFSGDGVVNFEDFAMLASDWMESSETCDLTGDDFVDMEDLSEFALHWLEKNMFDSNSDVITNPWLGLTNIGDSYSLAGYGNFDGATRSYSLIGSENVMGVNCVILNILGHGQNPPIEYYDVRIAQDTDGNLRFLKITGNDYEDNPVSWLVDMPENAPIFLPANPAVGEIYPMMGSEYHAVIALDQTVPQMTTGAGPYTGCMQYRWGDTSSGNMDDSYLCPGVGFVKEIWNIEESGSSYGWERIP